MKKATVSLLFLIILIISCWQLEGQMANDIRFSTITTSNGLSSNNINQVIKDGQGFIWVATSDGLCRYDGENQFKVFKADDGQSNSLVSSNIRALLIDSQDNLWIGTRLGGLTKLHLPTYSWTTYIHDADNKNSLSNNEVLTMIEDSQQNIWVGTEDGLNLYRSQSDDFIVFKSNAHNKDQLKSKAILSIEEDDKGWLWLGTWDAGLHLLLPSESRDLEAVTFRHFPISGKNRSNNVWKIHQDDYGNYWIGTFGSGLFLMNLPDHASNQKEKQDWHPSFMNYVTNANKHQPNISNNLIKDIEQDNHGNLWISTVNGLNKVSKEEIEKVTKDNSYNISFIKYFSNPHYTTSLSYNDINEIYEDDQGLLWFSTFTGLCQYNRYANQFQAIDLFNFDTDLEVPNSPNIYVDKDKNLWMASWNKGLLKYDLNTKELTNTPFSFQENGFSVYSIDDSLLYYATNRSINIIDRINNRSLKSILFPKDVENVENVENVHAFYIDRYNHAWIGTTDKLLVVDLEKERCYKYVHNSSNPKSICDNAIQNVLEDSYGQIWVSTYNGLNLIKNYNGDISSLEFDYFKTKDTKIDKSVIPSNRTTQLFQVGDTLYIGTTTGLCGYDLVEEVFFNFSETDNKYWVLGIEGHGEDLWLSTSDGIIQFNTKTHLFKQYCKDDGVADFSFRTGASAMDKEGNIYFGSHQAIAYVNPSNLESNSTIPPVYITAVQISDGATNHKKNIINTQELILNPNEYYLSINFTALNYNRIKKNAYAYKLEGLEEKWNYTNGSVPAVYTNLKYGNYTFRVKAANNDGIWNEEGSTLTIIKKPAFWETYWFYALVFCSVSLLIIMWLRYCTNNIRKRNEALIKYNQRLNKEIQERKQIEALLELQSKQLTEMNAELKRSNSDLEHFAYAASHDLKEPLRMISSFVGLLARVHKNSEDKNVNQYVYYIQDGVERMGNLIQNLLDYARVGQNEVTLSPINLNTLVELKLFDLSQMINERNASVECGKLPQIHGEKEQIGMVLYNLINNGIKFNKKENPTVKIYATDDAPEGFWKIAVSDNGIGIKPKYQQQIFEIFKRLHSKSEFEGTGIGLATCQKIMLRHGGEITVDSEEGVGTTFYLLIPKVENTTVSPSLAEVATQR